jgi:glycerophosphoryl diester phosphodiesterase
VSDVLACVGRVDGSSVLISCFDRATCVRVRSADDEIDVAWLVSEGSLVDCLDVAFNEHFNALNPHFSMVDAGDQQRAETLGLLLNAWTVNSARDLKAMGRLGVASVITDEPALALELLA